MKAMGRGLVAFGLVVLLGSGGCARHTAHARAPAVVQAPPQAAEPPPIPHTPSTTSRHAVPVTRARVPLSLRGQAVADTAMAGRLVRRCRPHKLLPEDEATMDAIVDLLRQARAAFAQGNVESASSYARSAKQLSISLRCP